MALMRMTDFNDLFQEMNRFQEEYGRMYGRNGGKWSGIGPAVNVWADDQCVFVETDLPGIDPNKLDVSVTEGNRLTIQGERPQIAIKNAVWHRQERGHGSFFRELTLPTLIDANKIEARFEHGVLRLKMPKAEAAKPRKIAVRT